MKAASNILCRRRSAVGRTTGWASPGPEGWSDSAGVGVAPPRRFQRGAPRQSGRRAAERVPQAATTNTAPVDLATPVDLSAGMARTSAIVRSGDARIEVLSPPYPPASRVSPTATFENDPTANALDRAWLCRPSRARSRAGGLPSVPPRPPFGYKVGSGPFTTRNTSVQFTDAGRVSTVRPTWQVGVHLCSGAPVRGDHPARRRITKPNRLTRLPEHGSATCVGDFLRPGAAAIWQVLGSPAGHPASIHLRHSTTELSPVVHTFDVVVNGQKVQTLTRYPDPLRILGRR